MFLRWEGSVADNPDMMNVLKSVARMILFGPPKKDRIPRDPLPGLIPPRPAPKIPYHRPRDEDKNNGPSVDELYKRFKASPSARKTAASKKKNTLDGR